MDIKVLNYTGISLKLSWDDNMEIISCNSEKSIQLNKSDARLTRFFAQYKSLPTAPVKLKGQINMVFNSAQNTQTLVLGAFVYGDPKYLGCIVVNDAGRYIYNEYKRADITAKNPGCKFYNIPLDLEFGNTVFGKLKKIYYTAFSTYNCENRDGPMCDKVIGMPVLMLIILFTIIMVIVVFMAIAVGLANNRKVKQLLA